MIMGRFRTQTVLVVDDDRDIRDSVRDLIEDEGYEAVAVRHGGEAQEWLLKNPPPAVILLDLMMPNMNGWQFLAWLRERKSLEGVPVVLMSGAPEHGLDLARRTRQLQGWLQKPFEPEALIEEVGKLVA
jgi:CheY-like chemotaxis protein